MIKQTTTIPTASIFLDEDTYPRKRIDPRRISIFAENIRDGFKFDPIEVEPARTSPAFYHIINRGIAENAHFWFKMASRAHRSVAGTAGRCVIKSLWQTLRLSIPRKALSSA